MVSALWNACSSGNFDTVREILNDATPADIQVKDQFGITPLIEAVRNGHADIVRALLDKGKCRFPSHAPSDPASGADPTDGQPQSYTSDPAILDILRLKTAPAFSPEDPSKSFQYGNPQPVPYPFYPPVNSAPPEAAAAFYPPAGPENSPGGLGNLPPPDIARFIPCRYFPACRYGASCMFLHPQQYYPGSLPPPAPYVAPFDPMNGQQYPPNYFPPPPFQPNGVMSPPPHPGHGPSPSEVAMPVQPPFSPNGVPPAPYNHMSPNAYPHPGQTPVPMMMAPLPPPHHQPLPPNPMYNTPASAPGYHPHDGSAPYPVKPNGHLQDFNGDMKPLNPHDAPGSNNHHPTRDPAGARRGGARRASLNGRKPPCLFFPSGRCKNGDDCRWPHVSPEANGHHAAPYNGRGPRPPRQPNGNSVGNLTEKMAGMNVRDDAPPQKNGTEGPNRPQHSEGRPRYHQGGKNGFGQNGARPERRPLPPKQPQRVPNADDFPVLAGSVTPPAKLNGLPNGINGHAGPTAAQILSAPAPVRKDASSKDSSTRGPTPDLVKSAAPKSEPNGTAPEPALATTTQEQPAAAKLPISFAAVAAPDLPKEIALSA
ncbi:hypothetical protein H0H92_000156 [Tricholoma furcatifolium]|nr:hypothetical protein H0H92_000156 [Tricholoma furcatifolium]